MSDVQDSKLPLRDKLALFVIDAIRRNVWSKEAGLMYADRIIEMVTEQPKDATGPLRQIAARIRLFAEQVPNPDMTEWKKWLEFQADQITALCDGPTPPLGRTQQANSREKIIDILEAYESGAYHPHPDANNEDAWPKVADAILSLRPTTSS